MVEAIGLSSTTLEFIAIHEPQIRKLPLAEYQPINLNGIYAYDTMISVYLSENTSTGLTKNLTLTSNLRQSSRFFKIISDKLLRSMDSFVVLIKSKAIQDNNSVLFLVVLAIVFISRLPFILPGYGIDPDTWGVAYAARLISSHGEYAISRFPGYPFQEYIYSLLWQGGPILMNGLTALLSGCAAAFLSLSIKKLNGQFPLLTGIVFAFIPVVYINSVNAMDYIWAICFILCSLYFLLSDRMLISGLFLGLAIGTRLTSGAMLLPFGILWLMRGGRKLELVKFAIMSLAIGGICFLPVFLKFGVEFFKFAEPQKYPWKTIVRLATVDVWGLVGVVTLGSLLVFLLFIFPSRDRPIKLPPYLAIWILAISLYLIAYLRLPYESGYLIPILPFLLIPLNRLLNKKAFLIFSMGILLSPFLFSLNFGVLEYKNELQNYTLDVKFNRWHVYVHPFAGPIIDDHEYRTQELERIRDIFQFGNTLDKKSLFVMGWEMPKFVILDASENRNQTTVVFTDFLTQDGIQPFIDNGYQIYFLPYISETSRELYGVDLQQIGAIPLNDSMILTEP